MAGVWSSSQTLLGSMACVIAQRRVHPAVADGNPLTEHRHLFVRACERVHQQVPSPAGWNRRSQARRAEGAAAALRAQSLQDAPTCLTCCRRPTTTGKVRLLTSTRRDSCCVRLCVFVRRDSNGVWTLLETLMSLCASFSCVPGEDEGVLRQKCVLHVNFETGEDVFHYMGL